MKRSTLQHVDRRTCALIQSVLDAEISAVFSEAMNADTLTSMHIKIANKNGELDTMISYSEEDFKVAIQPTSLALLAEYTVSFAPTITDLAGNPLEKTEWSFRTRDGKWSEIQVVEKKSANVQSISVAQNIKGEKIVVWEQDTRIFLSRVKEGTWSVPEELAKEKGRNIHQITPFIDDKGNITIFWNEDSDLTGKKYNATTKAWTSINNYANDKFNYRIAVEDHLGHIAFVDYKSTLVLYDLTLGTWKEIAVPFGQFGNDREFQKLMFNKDGIGLLISYEYGDDHIYALQFNGVSEKWLLPSRLGNIPGQDSRSDIAVDETGSFHVTWSQHNKTTPSKMRLHYKKYTQQVGWTSDGSSTKNLRSKTFE